MLSISSSIFKSKLNKLKAYEEELNKIPEHIDMELKLKLLRLAKEENFFDLKRN